MFECDLTKVNRFATLLEVQLPDFSSQCHTCRGLHSPTKTWSSLTVEMDA